jgi:hypothetical protein
MADELDPKEQNEELGRTAEGDIREIANDDDEEFEEIDDDEPDTDE